MFAPKLRTENVIRIFLIAVILFSALAPTTIAAQAKQQSVSTIDIESQATGQESRSIPTFERPEPRLGDLLVETISPNSPETKAMAQSAASVSFVSFAGTAGLSANDSYSVVPYGNGFLVTFTINATACANYDCLDYEELHVHYSVSGTAPDVYVRADATATGNFWYNHPI